jgi:hypothetical protein
MAAFEDHIQTACEERTIPGVVLLATDVEGITLSLNSSSIIFYLFTF